MCVLDLSSFTMSFIFKDGMCCFVVVMLRCVSSLKEGAAII